MAGHQHFGNRGHAHGVGTDSEIEADFGGRLIGRTGIAQIDAFAERNALGRGKRLSPRQADWLPKLFLNARDRVPAAEFDALCAKFGIEPKSEEPVDPERAEAVVAALAGGTEWAPPAAPRKGGRVYDDKKFYADVAARFGARRTISAKQLGALERMLLRYRAQIPGADELAARYGIEPRARRARKPRAK